MTDSTASGNFIELTAEIVSAYVSNNTVPAGEIPGLINQVHAALARVSGKPAEGSSEPLKPAVSVKKSITPEYIVCLEDGKKFKSLKRHLRTQYNMKPCEYHAAMMLCMIPRTCGSETRTCEVAKSHGNQKNAPSKYQTLM